MTIAYAAANGSGGNSGLSQLLPKLLYADAVALATAPGDFALARAGDSFISESITTPANGTLGNTITYGSYGVGARPIIRYDPVIPGFATPGNWTAGPSVQYFGNNVLGGTQLAGVFTITRPYVCPGTGPQTVTSLEIYASGVGTGAVRMGIYDSAGTTLICQGTAAVTTVAGPSFQGHLGQVNITPNPTTLTGGTTYLLSITQNATGNMRYSTGTSLTEYNTTDFTAGMPATATRTTASTVEPALRVGLSASPSTWTIPLVYAAGFGPWRLFLDDVLYMVAASAAVVNATNRWFWAADVLTVYGTSNPATFYTKMVAGTLLKGSWGVGNNAFDGPFHITKNWITVDGLEFQGGYASIDLNGCSNVELKNFNFGYRSVYGIHTQNTNSNVKIHDFFSDTQISNFGHPTEITGDGIQMYRGAQSNFQIYNGTLKNWPHNALSLVSTDVTDVITNNEIWGIDASCPTTNYGRGVGLTQTVDNKVTGNRVHHCYFHDLKTCAIGEESNGNTYDHNVVNGVTANSVTVSTTYIHGMDISFNPNKFPHDIVVYHNVFYNTGGYGIWFQADASHTCANNILKNNIFMNFAMDAQFAATQYAVMVQDGFVGFQTFMNNCFYKSGQTNIINWNGTVYTVAAWQAASDARYTASGNIYGDPLFVSVV